MMDMTEIFRQLVNVSLLASILALGLMGIKLILRDKLNASWHYAIWFVLLLRLLVPVAPPIPASIFNVPVHQPAVDLSSLTWLDSEAGNLTSTVLPDTSVVSLEPEPSANQDSPHPAAVYIQKWISWSTLTAVWAGGLMVIFIYLLIVNGLLYRKTRRLPACSSPEVLKVMQECQTKLKIPAPVALLYDSSFKSPALLGIKYPKIVISPLVADKMSTDELRYIFLHELGHLKRRDLLINAVVLVLQSVYWFNPLIWLALRQMKQDCEIACDAAALAALQPEEHRQYGHTIISLLQLIAEPGWIPGTLGFISKFNKRRIVMITKFKKVTVTWAIMALALTLVAGCSSLYNPLSPKTNSPTPQVTNNVPETSSNEQQNAAPVQPAPSTPAVIVYQNTQYGFSFTLPSSWQGYSIVTGTWEGNNVASGKVTETGPMLSIRHPQWTAQNPRQDIPILVLTIEQWNSLQKETFHIGAAPIPPSELGRNSKYVFALPARYNYAFPTGYQEVETILAGHPLQA